VTCPQLALVIGLLAARFEDCNEVHPQLGLKFLSPRDFLRLNAKRNPLPVGQTGVRITIAQVILSSPLLHVVASFLNCGDFPKRHEIR
jgi:hypothetical protein